MDLSKVFDCIPHDLLIEKMHAYGCSEDSLLRILLSYVPQSFILGPILVSIFINDLSLWVRNEDIHNFADDNTASLILDDLENLISNLERASEVGISWFRNNTLIVNPNKFQSIKIDHSKTMHNSQMFNTARK